MRELKLETFYFENLRFIHHSLEDVFADLVLWGILYWKNNELRLPMLEAFSPEESKQGCYPIPKDVVRLELEIEDREAQNVLFFQKDWGPYLESIDFKYLIPEKILKRRRKLYYEKYDLNGAVACWGYGDCFRKVFPVISQVCQVAYVCDNDKRKWGEEYEGCEVISPEELVQRRISLVVVTVLYNSMVSEISRQLASYGIPYCHINEWMGVLI